MMLLLPRHRNSASSRLALRRSPQSFYVVGLPHTRRISLQLGEVKNVRIYADWCCQNLAGLAHLVESFALVGAIIEPRGVVIDLDARCVVAVGAGNGETVSHIPLDGVSGGTS